ncbi:polysaccharide deacetylase family protein [Tateyamaria sp.]|uniref:polysaccharide deacetylase family protein n=1 Tax=Tateyamaria sp. TaxID=1929288 RepID=UPI003B2148AB
MTEFDWTPLRAALAACRDAGVDVPLWWRDDDAVAMTPALSQLSQVSKRCGVPVHLAIIPAHVDEALPEALDPAQFVPVVHGWAHTDYSKPGEKKNEFQTLRCGSLAETQQALDKMARLFGARLRPMFVPPWNRINDEVAHGLVAQGYRILSTYGPRAGARLADLDMVNTHVDPIWWKGTRDLVAPEQLIADAAAHLTDRASGLADAHEPFGLLTHHLVHTPAIWSFSEAFLTEMQAGGARPWTMETDK